MQLEELSFATDSLKLQATSPFEYPGQADSFHAVLVKDSTAFISFVGSEVEFRLKSQCTRLDNPLSEKDEFVTANASQEKLLLQFKKYLVQYSIDDLLQAGKDQQVCQPLKVIAQNANVTKLFFESGSNDFLYVENKSPNTVMLYQENQASHKSFVSAMY